MEEDKSIKNKIVVIDFMATWCGPCRLQDPILEDLKKKFEDRIEFKKINVDENNELTNKYSIHAVPTLVIEKEGNIFKKYIGVTSFNELDKAIEDALQSTITLS
jgi:thioredoxin 1